jgi:hypothetical protein
MSLSAGISVGKCTCMHACMHACRPATAGSGADGGSGRRCARGGCPGRQAGQPPRSDACPRACACRRATSLRSYPALTSRWLERLIGALPQPGGHASFPWGCRRAAARTLVCPRLSAPAAAACSSLPLPLHADVGRACVPLEGVDRSRSGRGACEQEQHQRLLCQRKKVERQGRRHAAEQQGHRPGQQPLPHPAGA